MTRTRLKTLAAKIKSAPDLWELHEALKAFEDVAETEPVGFGRDVEGKLNTFGIDLTELPVFGGSTPKSTESVWSWDEDYILAGEGAFREWEIRERVS